MAFLGLIPSEHSSGDRVKKGPITKAGNGHVRKALVEAAHAYRFAAKKSRELRRRQEGLPKDVLDISWKAQCRLCTRYHYLVAKGKNKCCKNSNCQRDRRFFLGNCTCSPQGCITFDHR